MITPRVTDPVRVLLHGTVATIPPSATLRRAARHLASEQLGLLVVVDRAGVSGVLSERDLVAAVAEDADLDAERVVDHASDDIVSVDEEQSIAGAARAMATADVRHLAVSRGGEIIGVVSARDVVAVLAGLSTDEALAAT